MGMKEFLIPFRGLKQGRHQFEHEIDNAFFESFGYDEFNGANIKVLATLLKTSTMMELDVASLYPVLGITPMTRNGLRIISQSPIRTPASMIRNGISSQPYFSFWRFSVFSRICSSEL